MPEGVVAAAARDAWAPTHPTPASDAPEPRNALLEKPALMDTSFGRRVVGRCIPYAIASCRWPPNNGDRTHQIGHQECYLCRARLGISRIPINSVVTLSCGGTPVPRDRDQIWVDHALASGLRPGSCGPAHADACKRTRREGAVVRSSLCLERRASRSRLYESRTRCPGVYQTYQWQSQYQFEKAK